VHTKRRLLSVLARELAFPAYFGANWDALADCLTDLSWAPAEGYAILLSRLTGLAQQDYFTALDVLEEAAIFWADNEVPFYVLMEGAGRHAYLPEVKAG
jgi:RNAse (barnase) inhibitor barstar